jgi:uncharacterized membrane protein YhdT
MNMKRVFVFVALGVFLISMMGGVLAITGTEVGAKVGNFVNEGKDAVTTVSIVVFEDVFFGDTEFLSKFFFAVLLAMIVYTVIQGFFEDSGPFIQWGITIAITFIAFFGVDAEYYEALRTSYGAMGLTILTVVPFMIIALFTIKVKNLLISKGVWGFYFFYYFFLVIAEWMDVIDGTNTIPYWVACLGGLVMFISIAWVRIQFIQEKIRAGIEAGMKKVNARKAAREISDKNLENESGMDF